MGSPTPRCAAAVVVVSTVSRVLTASPSPIGPATLAYNPYIGFTPASTADAIPSGTLATHRHARDGVRP